jgi:site-specific DNA recombinase
MNVTISNKIRCAIYTRKSTDEGLDSKFNSLDAQRESCLKYIDIQKHEGWYTLPESYDDGGFTGGNTKRPALKRLIGDIKEKQIDAVIVYKIDRLSRSMLDFLNLLKFFDEYNVSFVSVTQHFNTSTSSGKLMLNIMMSFGEYEREITRERTRDKIDASKKKGMWMGGYLPLGYDSKNKKLIINEKESKTARFIFKEFIRLKSLKKLAEELRQKEIRTKQYITSKDKIIGGNYFTTGAIYHILNNPIYIGKIKHKEVLYEGEHEAIISDKIWRAIRQILSTNPKSRAGITKRKVPAVLMGLLKCGGCNSSMTPTHTRKGNGKIYRYYTPSARQKVKCINCPIKQVSAPEVESIVLAQLHQMFQTPEVLVETWNNVNQKTKVKLNVSEEQVRESFNNIHSIWQELFPIEQEQLLKLMLEKVVIQPDHLDLHVKMDGLLHLAQNIKNNNVAKN